MRSKIGETFFRISEKALGDLATSILIQVYVVRDQITPGGSPDADLRQERMLT